MTTCRDALRAASGMLAQAGVPDPAVDAAFLLSHVTGTPHLLLRAEGWRELTQSQLADYQALIDRRCQREPLQYILGTAQFMGVTLRAQPGALIPRNDTETLCEQALARMQGRRARAGSVHGHGRAGHCHCAAISGRAGDGGRYQRRRAGRRPAKHRRYRRTGNAAPG